MTCIPPPNLHLFFGPMRSGKSTALRQMITLSVDIGLKAVYINHSFDVRNDLNSRNGEKDGPTSHHSSFNGLSPKIDYIKIDKLKDLDVSKYHVIGIDEGQFFDDIVETVRKWVFEDFKTVYIASLDGDFRIQKFGRVSELICVATTVKKYLAQCMNCLKEGRYTDAPFTGKLKTAPKIDGQIYIGGDETYITLCFYCHIKNI